jgi:serine phosphatase RsbU (regulator of sigma subunit)
MKRLIKYFLFPGDSLDPEKEMKAKYFLVSTFVFTLLITISFPYFFFVVPQELEKHPEIAISNIVFFFLLIAMLFIYRKFGGRILIVNIITFIGYGSNYGTYETNGGIWSSDHVWGFIISAWVFLVADMLSGLVWMLICTVTICFFLYVDLYGWKDFLADLAATTSYYPFFNFLFAILFLTSILVLYEKGKRRFVRDLKNSNAEIEKQKQTLEIQKEEIVSSISYAGRIQNAILPEGGVIRRAIPDSFILYMPRNIVSGDFYWFHEINAEEYILVCGDCTGHGVPGAFMTVVGSNHLAQIAVENRIHSPAKILQELDRKISITLKQNNESDVPVQDGMDASVITVNRKNRSFRFSSAKRPALYFQNGTLREFKGSKLSIGGMRSGDKVFEEMVFEYQPGDMLYLFTDGYIDQFGGPENKKYMIRRLRELLSRINKSAVTDQQKAVESEIRNWIGTNEQTDDILLIGIRL